jgi:hypothetical protein
MPVNKFAFIALCISIFAFAGCGSGDIVLNYNNSPIVAKSGQKNLKSIRRAIMLAGTRVGWQMKEKGNGQMVATKFSRGFMAQVNISYTTESYAITYKDSSNLKYNGQTIHPRYNKWVADLNSAIKTNLSHM